MIYHDIRKDAEHNTHAKIILEEIHNFSDKYKSTKFAHGVITVKVLENIEKCLLTHSRNLPEGITCNEVKMMAKSYLKGASDMIEMTQS